MIDRLFRTAPGGTLYRVVAVDAHTVTCVDTNPAVPAWRFYYFSPTVVARALA